MEYVRSTSHSRHASHVKFPRLEAISEPKWVDNKGMVDLELELKRNMSKMKMFGRWGLRGPCIPWTISSMADGGEGEREDVAWDEEVCEERGWLLSSGDCKANMCSQVVML